MAKGALDLKRGELSGRNYAQCALLDYNDRMKLFKDHNAAAEFAQDLNQTEQENIFKTFNNSVEISAQSATQPQNDVSTKQSSNRTLVLNNSEMTENIVEENSLDKTDSKASLPTFGNAESLDSFSKSA